MSSDYVRRRGETLLYLPTYLALFALSKSFMNYSQRYDTKVLTPGALSLNRLKCSDLDDWVWNFEWVRWSNWGDVLINEIELGELGEVS